MKRSLSLLGSCVLVLLPLSCTKYGIFEDVGADPHPPTLRLLAVSLKPPAPEVVEGNGGESSPAEPAGGGAIVARTAHFDTGGFTIGPGAGTIVLTLRWTDVGGDLLRLRVRDRDSSFTGDTGPEAPPAPDDGGSAPVAPDFFPGTGGEVAWELKAIDWVQEGPHRLEVWAEDSRESRSEKVEFVINFALF